VQVEFPPLQVRQFTLQLVQLLKVSLKQWLGQPLAKVQPSLVHVFAPELNVKPSLVAHEEQADNPAPVQVRQDRSQSMQVFPLRYSVVRQAVQLFAVPIHELQLAAQSMQLEPLRY